MRNVFEEYRQGLISWDKAFRIANNNAAKGLRNTEYWAAQMESLGCDAAEQLMKSKYGYKENAEGMFYKPAI